MKTKYYYTKDCYGEHIEENAVINFVEAENETTAKAMILELLRHDDDDDDDEIQYVFTVKPVGFADCWIKVGNENLNIVDVSPFEMTERDLIISKPGTHPGLSSYTWLEPRADIYVLVAEIKK